MTSLKELINITIREVEQLNENGIRTLEQLLEQGTTSTARMRLADETQLDDAKIKQWVHQADLMRINGIGPELAHLLCAVGVFTAPKLAYRSSDSLYTDLEVSNRAQKVMRRLPGVEELHGFIVAAKHLPKLIRH